MAQAPFALLCHVNPTLAPPEGSANGSGASKAGRAAAVGAAGTLLAGGAEKRIWTGAALGFGFGALGAGVSNWIATVSRTGAWATIANALIEIGTDGLVGGLSSGTSAALANGKFEDGFRSGFIMGAATSVVRVAVLGVKFDPGSVKADFHSETAKEFARQNTEDHSYLAGDVAKAGMPSPSSVNFRRGGLATFTLEDDVSVSGDTMTELRHGTFTTLAHEPRHVAQERAATLGTLEFLTVWLYQQITSDQQYMKGNPTLEPYYGR